MVSGHSGKPRELPVTNEWIEEQDKRWRQFYLAAGGKDIWHGFSCENFNFKSAQPPTCPEDCKLCCDQFVPTRSRQQSDQYPVAMHSDAKATEVIQTLIHTIENNYAYIKAKIDSHGNGIVNRWLKKTQAKREQLLLAAMPTLPTQKHSDMKLIFEAITLMSDFRNGRLHRDVLKRRRHHEDTHLLSSLSTTSLSEDPMRMLALMHYRSQAKAGDWMHFDREAIQHQFHSGLLQTAYNPHCVVAYGEAFGDLVPWEKNASHRWDIIGYPICRHLLRVQEKVSTMLRGTLDGILNPSIQDATKGRDTWDCLVHASFKSESRFIPKAAYYNNLFAAPPKFDLGHIVRVMRVRHEAAFDDAFTARTDPVYLRRLLQKVRNSTAYTRVDDQLKKFMIFEAPIYDILRFNAWNCFRHLARVLEETMKGKKLAQKPGSPLPRDYEKALMNLEAALRCRFAEQAGTVSLHVANSPSFAHHFKDRRQITIPKVAFDEDPLFWVIIELAAQNIDTNQTASWLFSFLDEHLSKASKKEKARIDQALYDHLADMAAVNEILSMIKYHKSYACLPKDRKLCERVYADDRLNSPFYVLDQHLYHCFNYEEIHDALQQFMSLPLPVKGSSPMKLQQHKDLFEQFLKYWYSIRRGLVKRMRQLEVSDGMQYQQLRLFDDYSGFVKYFFNEERKAIKRDIEAKGMLATYQ